MKPFARPSLTQLRRSTMQTGTRLMLHVAGWIGPRRAVQLGEWLGRGSHALPMLRRRLAETWSALGVSHSTKTIDEYFQLWGRAAGAALSVYHSSRAGDDAADRIRLDRTWSVVEAALDEGRGALLVLPHTFGYEHALAALNRRHPVVHLVRENKNPIRETIKRRWYEHAGVPTIRRAPRDQRERGRDGYLRVLREGKILAITPDLIVPGRRGVEVSILGRTVTLPGGPASLAIHAQCPLIPAWINDDVLRFDAAIAASDHISSPIAHPIEQMTREWAVRLERYLCRSPARWQFWLDKNWSRVLRLKPTERRQ